MSDDEKTLKWGSYEVSPSDVPAVSLLALAQRGWTHVFGNEVASALTAWRKTEEGARSTQEQIDSWLAAKRDAKLAAIMAGTLGVRAAGQPKATGIEALVRSIAVEWLKVALATQGAKLPSGDKVITVKGKAMTREQLIEATLRARGDKIRAEAERVMAERASREEALGDLFE